MRGGNRCNLLKDFIIWNQITGGNTPSSQTIQSVLVCFFSFSFERSQIPFHLNIVLYGLASQLLIGLF